MSDRQFKDIYIDKSQINSETSRIAQESINATISSDPIKKMITGKVSLF